ncbi:MAG: PAS domain-containing protein [Halobacteriovoraceae bacterium]|nr:PAS domain-containing protein [Halobacteriovoraceae bacterium]
MEKIIGLCESFTSQLHSLDSLYDDVEVKKVVAKMLSYVDSLKLILGKASLFHRDTVGVSSFSDLADKILEAFSKFQDIQYAQGMERDKKIKAVINKTKRNMMITLIIGFLGTIVLSLVVPGKIALPFKKIKDAIRELQDCNFDVSIYYNQDDEIGEIATEMNKMIKSFKVFDELRTDRISVENRKFDALANLVKRPVLVANSENKIIYINNHLYSLLQVQSEDIIGKEMTDTVVPKSIMEVYELAIKRRSKIENAEVVIPARKEKENGDVKKEEIKEKKAKDEKKSKKKTENDVIFKGHANVIPIRGKDSSLDYYLMVLSTEVFTL